MQIVRRLKMARDQNSGDDSEDALSSFLHSLHHPQWKPYSDFVR
jgi:hypothetical protein